MRRGVDVSANNHPGDHAIDWHRVHAAGFTWCAVKLTEGNTYRNPWAERDVHQAAAAGLEVIGYHFARPVHGLARHDAANLVGFAKVIGFAGSLALDLEDGRQTGWRNLILWTHDFITASHCKTIYWNEEYRLHLHAIGARFNMHQWVADYSAKTRPEGAAIWQYGQGHVDGITGLVDVNQVFV